MALHLVAETQIIPKPREPHEILGRTVIALADQIDANGPDIKLANMLHSELEDIRHDMLTMPPSEKRRFAPHVHMVLHGGRPAFKDAHDPGIVSWLVQSPDDVMVRFLRRNRAIVTEQQRESEPLIAAYKHSYIVNLKRGIGEGWASQDAARYEDKAYKLQVDIGDYWSTHRHHMAGYHKRGHARVVIAQGLGWTAKEQLADLRKLFDHALYHEINHALFEYKFSADIMLETSWFSEAMAEHLRLVMQGGRPEVIAPRLRSEGSLNYLGFRNLAYYVTALAPGGPIDARYLTRAYTSASLLSEDWKAMERQFDEKWGAPHAFWKICRSYADICEQVCAEHPEWSHFEQIQEAAVRLKDLLDANPKQVFGREYEKPHPRARGVALVR